MNLLSTILVNMVLMGGLLSMPGHSMASGKSVLADDLIKVQAFKWMSEGGSFLGVYLGEVDSETVEELGLKEEYGAHVKEVVEDSSADKAGLKKDDVIITWNNSRVESVAQLQRLVKETPVGRKVRLGLIRDEKGLTVDVNLGKRSGYSYQFDFLEPLKHYKEAWKGYKNYLLEEKDKFITIDEEGSVTIDGILQLDDLGERITKNIFIFKGRGRMGVMLQSLTSQLAEYFGLKDQGGALISSVREDSPADKAGLKAGDVIISIDGKEVEDPHDVMKMVRKKEEGTLNVVVMRDKREKSFDVILEKEEDFEKKVLDIKKPSILIHSSPNIEKV